MSNHKYIHTEQSKQATSHFKAALDRNTHKQVRLLPLFFGVSRSLVTIVFEQFPVFNTMSGRMPR
jgi:hypothetical protein